MFTIAAAAQNQPAAPAPVSYSSVNQLNTLLGQLQQTSQALQATLSKMRVDKWKTDNNNKRQAQANVESIQRNLQSALPEMVTQLQAEPKIHGATFKLYRNLDALYDVLVSVTESAGAFGSKDDFQGFVERDRRARKYATWTGRPARRRHCLEGERDRAITESSEDAAGSRSGAVAKEDRG